MLLTHKRKKHPGDSKAHDQAVTTKICGFTWRGKAPWYDAHTCVRKPDHKGEHRSKNGNRKGQ